MDGFKDGVVIVLTNEEELTSREGSVCVPLATAAEPPTVRPYEVGLRDGCHFAEEELRKAAVFKAERRREENLRQEVILQRIAEITAKYDAGEDLLRDIMAAISLKRIGTRTMGGSGNQERFYSSPDDQGYWYVNTARDGSILSGPTKVYKLPEGGFDDLDQP